MHTVEFTCQDCGEDIITAEDLDGVPLCPICRLEQEAKPAALDDAGVRQGLRHPLRRPRR